MAKIIVVTTEDISDKLSVLTQSLGTGLTVITVSKPHLKRIVGEEFKLGIITAKKSNLPSFPDASLMPPLIDTSIPFIDKNDNKPWYSRFDKKRKR